MQYSEEHKFIFISIHRTASSAIANILLNAGCHCLQSSFQHDNARTEAGSRLLAKHPDFYKFAFVRNPWERLFSWYKLITGRGKEWTRQEVLDFEAFLASYFDYTSSPESGWFFHFNQLDYLTNRDGLLLVDKIGRFENLEQDLYSILDKLKIAAPAIPILNTSHEQPYTTFYSKRARNFVAEKCAADIERFCYNF